MKVAGLKAHRRSYIYMYIGEGHWDFWLGGFAQSFVPVCCAVYRFSPLFILWFLVFVDNKIMRFLQICLFQSIFSPRTTFLRFTSQFFSEEKVNQLMKRKIPLTFRFQKVIWVLAFSGT